MSSKYWDLAMNFIGGCSPCSVGCTYCWAADCASKRLAHHPLYKGLTKNGKWTGEIRVMPELIKIIGGKPKTIFWNNMSDMFHEKVPFDVIDQAFGYMFAMSQHTHLVLTKRIDRTYEFFTKRPSLIWAGKLKGEYKEGTWPFPNVHLGVTICTPNEMWKAEELFKIPAAHRWISFEPLLGAIDLRPFVGDYMTTPITAVPNHIVVGCESGPKRRPCKLEWIESIVDQRKAAGVKCYVKQIPINNRVSHDPAEWLEPLRVRDKF